MVSVCVNLLLSLAQITVGVLARSQALLSDGVHSCLRTDARSGQYSSRRTLTSLVELSRGDSPLRKRRYATPMWSFNLTKRMAGCPERGNCAARRTGIHEAVLRRFDAHMSGSDACPAEQRREEIQEAEAAQILGADVVRDIKRRIRGEQYAELRDGFSRTRTISVRAWLR